MLPGAYVFRATFNHKGHEGHKEIRKNEKNVRGYY